MLGNLLWAVYQFIVFIVLLSVLRARMVNTYHRIFRDYTSFRQCSTVQYSTVQYSTVQYSTVQYSTVQYSTVQYSVTLCLNYRTFLIFLDLCSITFG